MIPMIGIDSNGIEVTTLVKTLVPEVVSIAFLFNAPLEDCGFTE